MELRSARLFNYRFCQTEARKDYLLILFAVLDDLDRPVFLVPWRGYLSGAVATTGTLYMLRALGYEKDVLDLRALNKLVGQPYVVEIEAHTWKGRTFPRIVNVHAPNTRPAVTPTRPFWGNDPHLSPEGVFELAKSVENRIRAYERSEVIYGHQSFRNSVYLECRHSAYEECGCGPGWEWGPDPRELESWKYPDDVLEKIEKEDETPLVWEGNYVKWVTSRGTHGSALLQHRKYNPEKDER